MTVVELLEKHAKELPDKTAVVYHDTRISYRHLNETVNRVAHGLVKKGMTKGDRIGLMLPRIPPLIIGFLAAAKVGGIVVPINFELPVEGVKAVLDRTAPRVLIVHTQFLEHAMQAAANCADLQIITVGKPESDGSSWDDLMHQGKAQNPGHDVKKNDVVYLNYTSGTSGTSKGAITTHDHIYWNTVASVEALGLTRDDIHLCMFAPFAHPHEIFARPLYLGGTMVLLENVYPKSLAQAIEDNRVTCMMGLAPMYENLLEVYEHKVYDLRSLRIPESGGMFTRLDLIERFQQKLGVPIIPVWGSTETTGIALANRPGKAVVPCSAGQPCPSYEIKIVNEEGIELPPGEVGEMIFRGPAVIQKYFECDAGNATCFRDGWYYSGDLARRDDQSNFFFIERKQGMMKVAGLKVFPLEIEQVLLDHPDIKEVAVISVKDRLRGEIPKAIIVAKTGAQLTEKEVLAFCRERLAHYKVPRIVEIRETLPKIGSGKVNKKALQMEHV